MARQAWDPELLAARMPFLRRRALVTQATRAFFAARGYMEAETPYLVAAPGEEVHLAALPTTVHAPDGAGTTRWLHTSPEFAMKKLLAGGAGRMFQLARVWRDNEGSETHAPEFTMLEWYRPGADFCSLIEETTLFLRSVLPPVVTCRGVTTDLASVEVLGVAAAFRRYCGLDVLASVGDADRLAADAGVSRREGEDWEDLFFRIMLGRVEPHLGRKNPTFLTDWPAPLAALARRRADDPRVAARFELYVCGMELANAFVELTDPVEQRARFEADRARRLELYRREDWQLDEDFIAAVGRMPECAGIALGFDRLAMIAAGAGRITDVLWL